MGDSGGNYCCYVTQFGTSGDDWRGLGANCDEHVACLNEEFYEEKYSLPHRFDFVKVVARNCFGATNLGLVRGLVQRAGCAPLI